MKKYLFIDRDGTLVAEPCDYQVDRLDKIRFEPYVIPSLLKLQSCGYTLVMVSNQDGLGTASFPLADFTLCHEFILNTLESQGLDFEQVLICPHKPEDDCNCRKPRLGLVMSYLKDDSWDRRASYFIGDRESDVAMGENMGIGALRYDRERLNWPEIAGMLGAGEELTAPAALSAEAALPRRHALIERNTRETQIRLEVDLDSAGESDISTGIGFFDHMLDQIATHGGISIKAKVTGDLEVDEHHTIEDTGIALGQALKEALGDKRGIERFGFVLPMDEVYARIFADCLDEDGVGVALDISGRPHVEFDFKGAFSRDFAGQMPTQMVPHFFEALAVNLGLTLHMYVTNGNAHHQVEALFKAFGRALRQALRRHGTQLPSSKGVL